MLQTAHRGRVSLIKYVWIWPHPLTNEICSAMPTHSSTKKTSNEYSNRRQSYTICVLQVNPPTSNPAISAGAEPVCWGHCQKWRQELKISWPLSGYRYTATNMVMHSLWPTCALPCPHLETLGKALSKPKMLWSDLEMTWTGRVHKLGHPCAVWVLLQCMVVKGLMRSQLELFPSNRQHLCWLPWEDGQTLQHVWYPNTS